MTRTRVALAASALILTACSAPPEASPDAPPATSAPVATPSTAGPPMHQHEHEATPMPSADPAGRTVVDLTLAAMTAFVDHGVDEHTWFQRLAPYLSAAARGAYSTVDPALIPATQLIGQPVVLDEGAYLAAAQMNTDVGVYDLLFSVADDGRWQVERIIPPEPSPGT